MLTAPPFTSPAPSSAGELAVDLRGLAGRLLEVADEIESEDGERRTAALAARLSPLSGFLIRTAAALAALPVRVPVFRHQVGELAGGVAFDPPGAYSLPCAYIVGPPGTGVVTEDRLGRASRVLTVPNAEVGLTPAQAVGSARKRDLGLTLEAGPDDDRV